jgi:hypothetical protein
MSSSPFSMKYETCPYYTCLTSGEKGDPCNKVASRIGCSCATISGPALSLAKHSKFLKPPSTRSFVAQDTAAACRPRLMRGWFLIFHEVEEGRLVEISTLMKKASNR